MLDIVHRHIQCQDGTVISVQASKYHHCFPKITGLPIYESYEVMIVKLDREIPEYLQISKDDNVGGYVPVEDILRFINEHGGFANHVNN
jgi:hypothetical protein